MARLERTIFAFATDRTNEHFRLHPSSMNAIFPTFLKRLYRKERISSFLIIIGAVDAVLGGVNEIGTLLILGLMTSGVAIGYRWWCIQQAEAETERKAKQLYLPAASPHRSPLDLDSRR